MKYRDVWGIFYKGTMQDFAHSKSAAEGIYGEDYASMDEAEHFEILNITPQRTDKPSTLAEHLRDIAHELPNNRSDVLLKAADKLEEMRG